MHAEVMYAIGIIHTPDPIVSMGPAGFAQHTVWSTASVWDQGGYMDECLCAHEKLHEEGIHASCKDPTRELSARKEVGVSPAPEIQQLPIKKRALRN